RISNFFLEPETGENRPLGPRDRAKKPGAGGGAMNPPGEVRPANKAGPHPTDIELTWREGKIEHWLRFGNPADEQRIDRFRRIVSFEPGSVFAFVRWAANDYGTVLSRIDIGRTVAPGEAYQTLPFVRRGAEL